MSHTKHSVIKIRKYKTMYLVKLTYILTYLHTYNIREENSNALTY